jgi:hypothetical protein
MAQKPDGKAARAERVTFTRPAAERIAKAVRTVEQGDRGGEGLSFDRVGGGLSSPMRVATFTGSWSTSTYKTVTLLGSTATASVYNWCNPSASNTSCSGYVIFGKVNGTNSVLELTLQQTCGTCVTSLAGVDLTQVPGYSAGAIQLLGHSAADLTTNNTACASLTWYSITTCSTAA